MDLRRAREVLAIAVAASQRRDATDVADRRELRGTVVELTPAARALLAADAPPAGRRLTGDI